MLKAHVGIALCILELIDHLANEVGPAITHQVLFLGNTRDHRVKIFHTVFLPTGLQAFCPGGIGRCVAANINGRRCALKHIKVLCCFTQERDTLDGGRAGTNDGNLLVI